MNQLSASQSTMGQSEMEAKFQGLIEPSFYQKTKNDLFSLFDYVTMTAPPLWNLHLLMSVLRIFQYFGPTFGACFPSVFSGGKPLRALNDFLSFFYMIVPASYFARFIAYIMYAYSGIFILMYIILYWSASYYAKEASLPSKLPLVISIFHSTLGYFLPPIAMFAASSSIVAISVGKFQPNAFNVIAIFLTILVTIIYVWLYMEIYNASITFKPDSIRSTIPIVSSRIFGVCTLMWMLYGAATPLDPLPMGIVCFIMMLLYFFTLVILWMYGGLINISEKKVMICVAVAGGLLMPALGLFIIMGWTVDEVIIIIIFAILIISYFVCGFVINKTTSKHLLILDDIEDNIDNFDQIKNVNTFCLLTVDGFRFAHPVCLDWQMFRNGIQLWPNDIKVWILFAKFTAIYPECTQQLDWIAVSISKQGLKGNLAQHVISQIHTVCRQRETNLISQLKSKLDRIGKQVQSTKHKIRHCWDLILQGNITELESAIAVASSSMQYNETEFQHLLRMFPNSKFAARAYSRFVKEVLADYEVFNVWKQNLVVLQRGGQIFTDQTYDFGLYNFTQLPKSLDKDKVAQIGFMSEDTLTQELDVEDESLSQDAEIRISIKNSINDLHIPSYTVGRVVRILILIVFFIVPQIVLSVFINIYQDQIVTPLEFMETLSIIRTRLFQIFGFSHRFLLEQLSLKEDEEPLFPGVVVHEHEVVAKNLFGDNLTTFNMLHKVLLDMTREIEKLSVIIGFEPHNSYMDKVRRVIFHKTFDFHEYSIRGDKPYIKMSSIQIATIEYVLLAQNFLAFENFTIQTLNDNTIRTICSNVHTVSDVIAHALFSIIDYLTDYTESFSQIFFYFMIVFSIVTFLVNLIGQILMLRNIYSHKLYIYKSIVSLPKNVVSSVSDSFRTLKKEDNLSRAATNDEVENKDPDNDINKQEENILKILSTSNDSSNAKTRKGVFIGIFVAIAFNIAQVCMFGLSFIEFGQITTNSAPHVHYMLDAYSSDFAALCHTNILAGMLRGWNMHHFQNHTMNNIIKEYQSNSSIAYTASRFGNVTLGVVPLQILDKTMLDGNIPSDCKSVEKKSIPNDMHDSYRCWSPDLLADYQRSLIQDLVFIYTTDPDNKKFKIDDPVLIELWHLNIVHIYSNYYFVIYRGIVPAVKELLNRKIPILIVITSLFTVVGIFVEIIHMNMLRTSEDMQKSALRLLMHCPGSVVIANQHLQRILAGNFTNDNVDNTTRDDQFYDKLLIQLPDAVVVLDSNKNIISANRATGKIFGFDEQKLITHNINHLGGHFKDGNPFASIASKDKPTHEDNTEIGAVYVHDDDEMHIHISLTVIHDNIVIIMKDDTQSVMANKLISDERARSDALLASILPVRLVARVQAGEKNISFAVQTVSVLFLDVVSFTPWCGSTPADVVMSTLNAFFKELDKCVTIHPTMTKVKCIGDCYMAAAGIFADVNQPAVHAKDIIDFGLDAIEALVNLNEKINQNLRIRVGINTGGPIVAGVLGTEKPTFEILGPTIQLAQQMEQHGVPMKVHIPRAVYELVYGANFIIKERGEIQVKKGTVVTYVVEGKK